MPGKNCIHIDAKAAVAVTAAEFAGPHMLEVQASVRWIRGSTIKRIDLTSGVVLSLGKGLDDIEGLGMRY
ncbi:hypothetical protein BTUL_0238g00050 [Botrytis tulipae]|uniref:Uncharacterized protein n=1 Tax=Botrytis tulipae TaxID=87230 RepID=A0A4Z1E6Z7_9HELO|nr:hypothetical protein BTUL_0238g00050 [Botrytis tulipae]